MNTQWTPVGEAPATDLKVAARASWTIVAVCASVGLLVGLPFGLFWLLVPGAVAGWFVARSVRNGAFASAVGQVQTRPASDDEVARVLNVVDGLCAVSGDRRPRIEMVDHDWPIAFAIASEGEESRIVVSGGFVSSMDRVETEAVMAHLLWRIRSGNAEFVTWYMAFHAFLSRLGLGSVAQRLAGVTGSSSTTVWADLAACQVTRYPPALVSALEKCRGRFIGTVVLAPLWFALPEDGGAAPAASALHSLGLVHSSLDERISILKEI